MRLAVAVLACCAAGAAHAQFAGRISLASDDRFRGHSLSDQRPTASLELNYDAPRGLYLGGAATAVATAHDGLQPLGAQVYAGYVKSLADGRAFDLGLTHANYTDYYSGGRSTGYTEAFVGLTGQHFATRLYYSPSYFGGGAQTVYGEAEAIARPAPAWRLTAHVGLLQRVGGASGGWRDPQYDWRLALARTVHGLDVQLAWTGFGPRPPEYAPVASASAPARQTVVIALGHSF